MQSKKGVSDVITTVLMIVLVVAAISILRDVILNIVRNSTGGVEDSANFMTNAFSYSIDSATWTSPSLSLKVLNNGYSNLSAVTLSIFLDRKKTSWYLLCTFIWRNKYL
jgi:hypothetical protein